VKRAACLYADNEGCWRCAAWTCRLLDRECRGCSRTLAQIDAIAKRIIEKETKP
jgi:hypothetical protein